MKKYVVIIILIIVLVSAGTALYKCFSGSDSSEVRHYQEIKVETPNVGEGVNEVKGIILHHTAEPTAEASLEVLCSTEKQVSCHVMIDTDGTRYILLEPTAIAWHAGFSVLNGREKCNDFTIGIEFQGNTTVSPLTDDQIASGIEYILPLMKRYNIKKENIASHEKVRMDWIALHPDIAKAKGVSAKVDITNEEYLHFMQALDEALANS